jgi:NADH dehydrogenase [ubiquinone] 1 alpha subcomplex assembly factor 7
VADLAREEQAGHRFMTPTTGEGNTSTSSLATRLKQRIKTGGPISVEAFMEACLLDAAAGAYAARQPIGAKGDFITAPEISQIFGELLGLWAATVWQGMGEPDAVTVAELGPGRGTLMADALRAARVSPKFLDYLSVALVERSPVLAATQRDTLRGVQPPVNWYAALDEIPRGPLIVIANEFVDALPIRQFVRRGDAWYERLVMNNAEGFAFAASSSAAGDEDAPGVQDVTVPEGGVAETRPAALTLLADFASRAADAPLAALIIDYGHDETGFGDTLQAVRAHRYADPLAAPGDADLSAHVDFAALKRSAEALGLKTYGPMPQGEFLLKLGLGLRRDQLLASATKAQEEAIISGAARLVDPRKMGVLFKVLALTSAGLQAPPPFVSIGLTLS